MAVSPSTTTPVAPARGWQIPVALVKNVLLDPGIIYTSADILLFAGTNMLGLGATIAATGIAAGLKTLSVLQPGFINKYPKMKAVAFDDRTPLRAGALSLLVVGGAALSGGALLPAAASFLFAAANFRMAESISKHHKQEEAKKALEPTHKPDAVEITVMMLKRPDLYLNAGFACAGLMAGGAALFVLPVVAAAFGISVRNAVLGKPEYAGHPKMLTAASGAAFATIGHHNGHGLIAIAHAMNAAVLLEIERRVTPGGMFQIAKDLAMSCLKLVGIGKDKNAGVPAPEKGAELQTTVVVMPEPVVDAPSRLPTFSLGKIFGVFSKPPVPANENHPEAANDTGSAPAAARPQNQNKL
ncbi:MAG: hypothetical protein PW788_03395 [Micavibrio sp.]|nr:hypothetical protein [Micavibrio sp.]